MYKRRPVDVIVRKIYCLEVTGTSRGGKKPNKTWIETIRNHLKRFIRIDGKVVVKLQGYFDLIPRDMSLLFGAIFAPCNIILEQSRTVIGSLPLSLARSQILKERLQMKSKSTRKLLR